MININPKQVLVTPLQENTMLANSARKTTKSKLENSFSFDKETIPFVLAVLPFILAHRFQPVAVRELNTNLNKKADKVPDKKTAD